MKNLMFYSTTIVCVILFSVKLLAQEKYTQVVKFASPARYDGIPILAVTAGEQKDNFQKNGIKCKSFNEKTNLIAAERANVFCRMYLGNQKATVIGGDYVRATFDGQVYDPKSGTTTNLISNNGNFYCIFFADGIFENLSCGVPLD